MRPLGQLGDLPSNPAEHRIWQLYRAEIEAVVAQSPPLTAQQIREIRAALPITREAPR